MTVQLLPRSSCEHCGRICYERGRYLTIEAAVGKSEEQPVEEYLHKLEKARGPRGRNQQRLADILVRFDAFANDGSLRIPLELNYLTDDIWEIKTPASRLPFYYVVDASHGNVIRLTSGFDKNSQKTPPKEIRKALAVMRYDRGWTQSTDGGAG